MAKKKKTQNSGFFDKFANTVMRFTGSPTAFFIALGTIVIWAVLGPVFDFSDTWQLVINTSTTIITFLMVFVIQQSQNKDSLAVQLKLNELIACNQDARNRLVDVEDLSDEELQVLKKFYVKLAKLSQSEEGLYTSHSVDEAQDLHDEKQNAPRRADAIAKKKAKNTTKK